MVLNMSMDYQKCIKEIENLKYALSAAVIFEKTDKNGIIIYADEKFCKISGYSETELLGATHKLLNAGYHTKEFFDKMWSVISCGDIWKAEVKNKAKDGSFFWLDTTIVPIIGEDGFPYEYLAFRNDITDRKKADEELEYRVMERTAELDEMNEKLLESYLIYSGLFDNNKSIMLMIDAETGAITDANPAACRFYGYNNVEIIKMNISDLDSFSRNTKFVHDQSSQAGTIILAQHKLKDGSIRDVEVHISPITMNDKDHYFTIVHDITEKKRAERELIENEKMIRDLMNAAGDAIIIVDDKALITHWNMEAEKMFEYTSAEVLGKEITKVIQPTDFYNISARNAVPNVKDDLDQNLKVVYEHKARKKSGIVFPVEASISLVRLGDKTMVISFSRDITDRKNMEAQLLLSQKLESIGQLAAGIAHEINTPMQFISDNTNFLKEAFGQIDVLFQKYGTLKKFSKLNHEIVKFVKESGIEDLDVDFLSGEIPKAIEQSIEGINRVTQIVLAMKDFSHSGGKEMQYYDINKAIESTVTVSRSEWKYWADMELNLDPDLPNVCCTIDEINQVVLNMIVNGAQAIQEALAKEGNAKEVEQKGKITISTCKKNGGVEISIRDTGAGIPDSIMNRIYEPFFTTKEVGKGTGQGLSIAHSIIVGKHKGKITVESQHGNGAKFMIYLPINCAKEN